MIRRLAIIFLVGILSTYIGAASVKGAPQPLLGYKVILSPLTGYVNTKVVVSVNQYPANKSIQVTFDGVYMCTLTTAADGTGSCYFRVPATDEGLHYVYATGGGMNDFRFFNVEPRVKLTPNYGPRGTTMNVSLRGFLTYITVTVKWYNSTQKITIKTLKTSGTGSANFYFTVPSNAMVGPYKVWAREWTGKTTAATFTVTT